MYEAYSENCKQPVTALSLFGLSRAPTDCNLEIERERVKNVKETVYLGVKLSEDGKLESEVERRIGMTMQAVGAMKKVYESRETSREANVAVFKAVAVPTLTWV